jgi:hypothetical protein
MPSVDYKLWVVGGTDGKNSLNDVWFSPDGRQWTRATGQAAFTPRWGHAVEGFDRRLWVLGGQDGEYRSDVWRSP